MIAREDRPGDKRLVGYVVGGSATLDAAGIRAQLAERLPAYMVPAAVVVLEALPLTANGKLDTRALPAPEYADADHYRAPDSAVEEILAGIYAEVLGVEHVGIDDSFFDLGGDCLSAMQVVTRARAAGLTFRPRDIFVEQTVARLAGVAAMADGAAVVVDEGIGPVLRHPDHALAARRGRPSRAVQPDGAAAGTSGSRPGRRGGRRPGAAGSACHAAAARRRRRPRGLVVTGARTGFGGCA